jgi:large subunit ribosomal protein L18
MDKNKYKAQRRLRRRRHIRNRIEGTPDRPRLSVYRSLKHIYVQIIDDYSGETIACASTRDKDLGLEVTGNAAAAAEVGKRLAELAKDKGIEQVCFDRNGFIFHGRVKAMADAAREGGLKF